MVITTKGLHITLSILSLAASTAVQAASYFVSLSGKDSNPGTLAAPWQTLQRAANVAKPGDQVQVRGGTYKQRTVIQVNGTASAPIVFTNYNGEQVIYDLTGVAPVANLSAIIRVSNRSYVTIKGFTLRNYKTADARQVPAAILIDGACKGVKIVGNVISAIEQNNATPYNFNANAHGIAVYGTAAGAIDGLEITDNSVSNLRLGASEAIALNGNVTNFLVARNLVQNCNNIGIDVIGFEGTNANASLDRARNGRITGNTVIGIDSSRNPAYGGNFTTGGGGYAAAGIYVDGGTNVVIDGNDIYGCNLGIELGCEHLKGKTDNVVVSDNLVRHNYLAGISLGGYDEQCGATENCTVVNNTIYQNGVRDHSAGQIQFQFYARKNVFLNNVLWAGSAEKMMVVHNPDSTSASKAQKEIGAGNIFSYNLYYASGATTANCVFRVFTAGSFKNYVGLTAWRNSGKGGVELGTLVANPKFAGSAPNYGAARTLFKLASGSPAIDKGSPTFGVGSSELDVFGLKRLVGGRIDIGAGEAQ